MVLIPRRTMEEAGRVDIPIVSAFLPADSGAIYIWRIIRLRTEFISEVND